MGILKFAFLTQALRGKTAWFFPSTLSFSRQPILAVSFSFFLRNQIVFTEHFLNLLKSKCNLVFCVSGH